MFKTRLISGIVLVALALLLIITGGNVLLGALCVISLIGMFELYRIFKIEKEPAGVAGYIAAIVYYLNLLFGFIPDMMMFVLSVLVVLMFIYVFSYPKYKTEQMLAAFFCGILCGSDAVLCIPDENASDGNLHGMADLLMLLGL